MAMVVLESELQALGVGQLTGLSAVKALNPPPDASYVLLQAESQNIRYRDDETDPTAAIGVRLIADSQGFWYTGPLARLRFLEESASGVLNYAFYKPKLGA